MDGGKAVGHLKSGASAPSVSRNLERMLGTLIRCDQEWLRGKLWTGLDQKKAQLIR